MRSVVLLMCSALALACGGEGDEALELGQSDDGLEQPEASLEAPPARASDIGGLDALGEPGELQDRSSGNWEDYECGDDHQCRIVVYRDGKRVPDGPQTAPKP